MSFFQTSEYGDGVTFFSEGATAAMGTHHTAFATNNLRATHHFYTEGMGFDLVKVVVGSNPEGGWSKHVFYDIGDGDCIAFWEIHDTPGVGTFNPAIATGLGLPIWSNHLAFRCELDEIEAKQKQWLAYGCDTTVVDHEFCRSVYTLDPNGIMVEWCADTRPFTDDDRAQAQARLWLESDDGVEEPPRLIGIQQADPEAKAARKAAWAGTGA